MSEEILGFNEIEGDNNYPKYRAIAVQENSHDNAIKLMMSSAHSEKNAPGDSLNLSSKHFVEVPQFTKPARVPVSSSSSALAIAVAPAEPVISKCSEKPCHLSNTNFYCDIPNFEDLKNLIEENLRSMSDFDWNYFEDDHMWKCKYLEGSNMREFHITCFWDSATSDHIVEVKRVRGDGLQPSNTTDIFAKLKSKLSKSTEDSPVVRRGKLRGPLPLPSLKSAPSLSLKMATNLTEEQFLKGVHPIVSMTEDNCFEPRLEAARMLCDLALTTKSNTSSNSEDKIKYVNGSKCRELVLKALSKLLQDDFEDVKQFAVVAFEAFCQYESYQECLSQDTMMLDIISLIHNCPSDVPSYTCAQMRRKAAQSIAALVKAQPAFVHHQMILCGFATKESWENNIVHRLYDVRTQQAASKVSACFDVSSMAPPTATALTAFSTLTTQATESTLLGGGDDSATTHSADTSSISSDDDEIGGFSDR